MDFRHKIFEKLKNKRFLIITFLFLTLVSVGILDWSKPKKIVKEKEEKIHLTSEADIIIIPTQKDASGVAPTSTFILSSKSPVDKKTLKQVLKIFPQTPFEVKEKEEKKLEIVPQKTLETGKIYRFILPSLISNTYAQELTFAFQIKTPFSVIASLPGNQATGVPLNTSIEVYFNNPEFNLDSSFFEIFPQVDGRFEKHQNTLVFLPKKLEPITVYTVKIKKGFSLVDDSEKLANDYIFQFETGFEEKQPLNRFKFSRFLFEGKPNQVPFVILNNWDLPANSTKAKIYQLDQKNFLDCLKKYLDLPTWTRYAINNVLCQKPDFFYGEFTLEPKRTRVDGQYYFELPEALPSGFYLLEVENPKTTPSQSLIEITPLSWYYWIGGKETIFWVNHLDTKSPASGSVISNGNIVLGQTNSEGLLKIETPDYLKNKKNVLLTIKQKEEIAFVPVNFLVSSSQWDWFYSDSSGKIEANNFWSYLYLDRQIFLPTDKVNFWGLVKHREGNVIKRIKVKLFKGDLDLNYEDPAKDAALIEEKELELSSFGTFIGNFEFKNLPPYWYSLGIFVDDILVYKTGFSIQTFQKPAYRISVQPEKVAIWAGEKNKIKINVSFWDGTPVAYTTLVWTLPSKNQSGEIRTNQTGEANLEISTSYDSSIEYWPEFWFLNIHPKLPEEAEIKASTSFFVFGPKISLSGRTKWENGLGWIYITAKSVDSKKIQENPWDYEGEPIKNLKVRAEIWRRWYEKIEIGEEYNPIEKIIQKKYHFEPREERIKEQETITNEAGQAELNFSAVEDQQYKILLSATDDQGREVRKTAWLWTGPLYESEEGIFTIAANKEKFRVGEKVSIGLSSNGQSSPENHPNYYLILGFQNGRVLFSQVQNKNQFEFDFQSNFIPNILLRGVWFNGDTYQETSQWSGFGSGILNLSFDYKEEELNVDFSSDKKEYQPGEAVKLKIKVSDKKGNPQKAKVLISSVDEALSDLMGIQPPKILSTIYRSVNEGKFLTYASHPRPKPTAQAEGGGGGGAREKFENTALFTEVETQTNGLAEVNFKLPDNITTWNLSLAALGENLTAGESRLLLPVTKPLFVQLITADEFLVNDKPKISFVAYGRALSEGTPVNYKIKSTTLGIDEQNLSQKSFKPLEIPLPQLKLGEHKIEVWAEALGYKDGLARRIQVIDTRLVKEKAEFIDLKEEFSPTWDSVKSVRVIVTDKSKAFWYPRLQSLAHLSRYGENERSDRLGVEMKAKEILNQYFNEENSIDNDLSRYQTKQGISLFPYSDEDLVLSAKLASLDPPTIDKENLKKYFWKKYNQERSIERAGAALWGLASLGEPVLNNVSHLLNQENTPEGKLYLGLAAVSLGDQSLGREVLDSLIKEFGVREQPFFYLKIGQNKEEHIRATALGMVLSSYVNQGLVEEMWQYLENNPGKEGIYFVEKLLATKLVLERIIDEAGSFEYWLGDKKVTKELEPGQSYQILLTPSQTGNFKIKPLKGRLGLAVYRWEKFNQAEINKIPQIGVGISTVPEGRLSSGQTMEIRLESTVSPSAFEGEYFIAVNLPSGLRYIRSPYQFMKDQSLSLIYSWPIFEEGNRLVFWRPSDNKPIRILARPVNKGTFIFEPAMIYHSTALNYLNLSPQPKDVVIE